MAQPWVDDAKFTLASISSSSSHPQPSLHAGPRHRNVFRLLALREISPCTKYSSKRFWQGTSKWRTDGFVPRCEIIDAKHALISWVEAESLRNLSAKYCPLLPPPRSTIAAAFSSDGKTLASTHGDHTVKIIDCQTGSCLKVLSGHRRTPWVVRFHPLHPQILASGSLDHEVRLWDAHTADCIGLHDFYRPIASIAFHSQGELLAVASGHKLFMWNYNNRRGEASSPTSVLKTKRSLRAVHFHPYTARLLLTAEVNGLDSPDYPLTLATTSGYLQYPPAVFFANDHSSTHPDLEARVPFMPSPYLFWPTFVREGGRSLQQYSMFSGSVNWQQREESSQQKTFSNMGSQHDDLVTPMEVYPGEPSGSNLATEIAVDNSLLTGMEVTTGDFGTESMVTDLLYMHNVEALVTSSAAATTLGHLRDAGRNASRHRSRSRLMVSTDSGEGAASLNAQIDEVESQSNSSSIQSEFSTSLAAAATAELPCTVKLRIWSHDIQDPCASLDAERCLLTIPHAVLCSEMGAHFSPCGRFLAACVACVLPHLEGDPGLQMHPDVSGAATSPTRHPLSGHQVMYELRIYSLEAATFGLVLASSAIRAAHCLTSIQFSPTSEHLLLAYGRRHGSLLRSIVIDGETAVHTYTIMEVYRVSDMELVRVLPSAEDEVNVACFHPLVGGGLVYGTKEGKLRIFQCDGPRGADCMGPNFLFEENMLEVQRYALEC